MYSLPITRNTLPTNRKLSLKHPNTPFYRISKFELLIWKLFGRVENPGRTRQLIIRNNIIL